MDLTNIFLTVVVFLLANIEVGSNAWKRPNRPLPIQSYYRRINNCTGGNLLKIHINSCSNGLCKAKVDGASTRNPKSRFTVIDIAATGKKCIQFQLNKYADKYALRVVSGNNVAFEKRICDENISNEFQFHKKNATKDGTKHRYVYKYSSTTCLGVAAQARCDDATLSLIETGRNVNNRRCFFEKP